MRPGVNLALQDRRSPLRKPCRSIWSGGALEPTRGRSPRRVADQTFPTTTLFMTVIAATTEPVRAAARRRALKR